MVAGVLRSWYGKYVEDKDGNGNRKKKKKTVGRELAKAQPLPVYRPLPAGVHRKRIWLRLKLQ